MKSVNTKSVNIVNYFGMGFLAVAISSVAFAEPADTVRLDKSEVSKEAVIEILAPKTQTTLKTRGIRVHASENNGQQSEEVTGDMPRSLSLEVYFEFDSAVLDQEAISQLAPVGEALQSNELSGLSFTLEGHTDASGDDSYNLQLSERRAQSVRKFFVENFSVTPDRVAALGKGESELIEGTPPNSGINRRVTIIAQ